MPTITYELTKQDLRSMRVARVAAGLMQRVMEQTRSSTPSAGAELDPALPLFYEAGRALISRCPTASAVVCRGSLEATLHAAIVRASLGSGRLELRTSPGKSPRNRLPGLDFLLKEAQASGLLNGRLYKSARMIKADGDFGAHLASRWDAQVLTHSPVHETPASGNPTWRPIRLWVTEDRALSNLKVMGQIIEVIVRRVGEVGGLTVEEQAARLARLKVIRRTEWNTHELRRGRMSEVPPPKNERKPISRNATPEKVTAE